MIIKKIFIYGIGAVFFVFFNLGNFSFGINQSLKPGSEDRGYVDGWYCSSSKENKINENDSPYVQNRDYTCQMPGNPENGKCLFEITDTYDCTARTSKKHGGTNYYNRGYLWDYESCVFNNSYLNNDLNIHASLDDNDLDGIDGNPGCAYDKHQDSGEPGQGVGTKLEDYCKTNGTTRGNSDDTNSVLWEYTSTDSGAGVDGHEKNCEDYEGPYCEGTRNGTIRREEWGCNNGYCANGHDPDEIAAGLGLDSNNDNGRCDRDSYRTCEGGGDGGDRVYYRDYCSSASCSYKEYNRIDCGTNYYTDRRSKSCYDYDYQCATASKTCSSTSCSGVGTGRTCNTTYWTVSDTDCDSDSVSKTNGKYTTLVHKGCNNNGLNCYTRREDLGQPSQPSCNASASPSPSPSC